MEVAKLQISTMVLINKVAKVIVMFNKEIRPTVIGAIIMLDTKDAEVVAKDATKITVEVEADKIIIIIMEVRQEKLKTELLMGSRSKLETIKMLIKRAGVAKIILALPKIKSNSRQLRKKAQHLCT